MSFEHTRSKAIVPLVKPIRWAGTAAWLAGIEPKLRDRPAAVGLVVGEQPLTVAEFAAAWVADKRNPAQHLPACVRTDSQTSAGNAWNQGSSASPNDVTRAATRRREGIKRECMGIEPTWSFVQTPHWF